MRKYVGLDQVDQGGCLNIANTQVDTASTQVDTACNTALITGSVRMERSM